MVQYNPGREALDNDSDESKDFQKDEKKIQR